MKLIVPKTVAASKNIQLLIELNYINHVLSIEDINADTYPDKHIKRKIIKTNDTSISNESRKSTNKHKSNEEDNRNSDSYCR